jgi:hypothetical protein
VRAIVWVLSVVVLLVGTSMIVAFSGVYNVSATQPNPEFIEWIRGVTLERSVKRYANGIDAPRERLVARESIEAGHRHYRAMCETCHAAPGVDRSEIGEGLYPPAPDLWLRDASHLTPGEIYWIVAHGVKNTGMPAFGKTHEDRVLWELVAFVDRLPLLSADEYAALGDAPGGSVASERDVDAKSSAAASPVRNFSATAPPRFSATALPGFASRAASSHRNGRYSSFE